MKAIFSRTKEIQVLEQLYFSKKAEFLTVYGRRRVGKTFLIREFFKEKGLYFALTGVLGASMRKQLKNFKEEFERVFHPLPSIPRDWAEAFSHLRKAIAQFKKQQRIILFFDELPWLATPRSAFLQDLDHLWNRYFSEDARIILVICGSAASWMIKKVLSNKGGLYGRLTAQIRLLPFDLRETEGFLQHRGIFLTRKALLDLYMAIGGIPKYLNYVQRGQSAIQIVSQLCFGGPLEDEFEQLYASLFQKHHRHVQIVKILAKHAGGLTKTEISQRTQFSMGGGMNLILEELAQCGFILEIGQFGKQKKESRFKLVDEFSLFYLKWKEKFLTSNLSARDEKFWLHLFRTPTAYTWMGYAFETVCFKHLINIKRALGIEGVLTSTSAWFHRASSPPKERGVQIDLLIDRADQCINLCEMKYCEEEFLVTKAIDQELREKKRIFSAVTKTKKSLFLTLISPYGVKKGAGHFEIVDVSLTLDSLFS